MTEYHGSPGEHVVDVRISIHIVEPGALGSLNKPRLPTYGSERTNRAVDPARNELLGLLEELDRSDDFHNGGAPYHAKTEGSRKWLEHYELAANCLTWGQKVYKWIP